MKIIISQSDLLKNLKIVSRAVSGQQSLPILANILIRAEGQKVHFSATNLEVSICTSCEAEIKNEGSITIPAKILTAYISLLKDGDNLDIETTDDNALLIKNKGSKTKGSKTKIKGISADEYPEIPHVEGGTKLEISGKNFLKAIGNVALAAQENPSRPVLGGVLFQAEDKILKMVATDSYRLSEDSLVLSKDVASVQCIVPVRALQEAGRIANDAENIVIWISENQILFQVDNYQLNSRLITGQFPDYQQIIPKKHETRAFVNCSELIQSVRRVSIFAKENNQSIKISIAANGELVISTKTTQIGEDIATINSKVEGQASTIALNADYLLDILSVIKDETVRLELNGSSSPIVIKREKDNQFTHLIMPLKI
jgi:DNA polymerase-3 subunit beta